MWRELLIYIDAHLSSSNFETWVGQFQVKKYSVMDVTSRFQDFVQSCMQVRGSSHGQLYLMKAIIPRLTGLHLRPLTF